MGPKWYCSNWWKSSRLGTRAETAHYKSIVAYDGTAFQGFQRQKRGSRTVQGTLEQALTKLGWEAQSLKAAGRTDAGVHALGQVVAYELVWSREPDRLTEALNSCLPSDVAVRHTALVAADFHPRFSALGRRYSYRLMLSKRADPMVERFAWRIWPQPEFDRLAEAARLFVGEHDFGAFGRPPVPGGQTVRRIGRAEWQVDGDRLCLWLEANAFLNRMVRRVVAAIVQVGWGIRTLEEIQIRIKDPSSMWPGRPAPAKGLCLEEVFYAN